MHKKLKKKYIIHSEANKFLVLHVHEIIEAILLAEEFYLISLKILKQNNHL